MHRRPPLEDRPASGDRRRRRPPRGLGLRCAQLDIERFDHPRKVFNLTELPKRGHSDADVRLVPGGNFRRMLDVAWRERREAEQGDSETT